MSAPPPSIKVHAHTSPRITLLPVLLPLLPYTLPLVRRIQFHLQTPHALVLSTIPPAPHPFEDPPQDRAPLKHPEVSFPTTAIVFAAAYVDRSRAPETECWMFSSLELPSASPRTESENATALAQIRALLAHIHSSPLPPNFPVSNEPDLLLTGAVHLKVLELLKGQPVKRGEGKRVVSGTGAVSSLIQQRNDADEAGKEERVHGSKAPNPFSAGCIRGHTLHNTKFLFSPALCTSPAPSQLTLPPGLVWSTVREEEYALVKSRTEIPRQDRTMRILASVGVRKVASGAQASQAGMDDGDRAGPGTDGELVAWAFLGPDGSLTSLHVEAEFRGKGLAKMITRKLFSLLAPIDQDASEQHPSRFVNITAGTEWAHSDVTDGNEASVAVARSVGGTVGWGCFWSWVDLERV